MFIKSEEEWRYWNTVSKLGKSFKKRRKRTIFHFKCDKCNISFTRTKGSINKERLTEEWKHFCNKCQRRATQECAVQARKENLLGSKIIDHSGYVAVYVGDSHKFKKSYGGRIREHVIVMENHLGRSLKKGEVVHHIDGDKMNNDIENLDLCSVAEHNQCHAATEKLVFELYKRGNIGYCRNTKRYFLID